MLLIIYPPGVNWFYEAVARDVHDDLSAAGIQVRLIAPQEFIGAAARTTTDDVDVLIVNAVECVHSLAGPAHSGGSYNACLARLRERLEAYPRRFLLNMDGIHTSWFRGQMAQFGDVLTGIFDLGMVPQTKLPVLRGCRYAWIPESFTRHGRQGLLPSGTDRPIPWAVVGHATRERAELAEDLMKVLSPSGLVFLPGLRPFCRDGSRSLSEQALGRVLSRTQYYVWISHHRAPYHEGLRALHAVANGAIPAKIDPLFSLLFEDVPWVYESLEAFVASIELNGPRKLHEQARDFLLARDTLGFYVAGALGGNAVERAPRHESPSGLPAPHAAAVAWPEREPLVANNASGSR